VEVAGRFRLLNRARGLLADLHIYCPDLYLRASCRGHPPNSDSSSITTTLKYDCATYEYSNHLYTESSLAMHQSLVDHLLGLRLYNETIPSHPIPCLCGICTPMLTSIACISNAETACAAPKYNEMHQLSSPPGLEWAIEKC
jgi:hypothetical protein